MRSNESMTTWVITSPENEPLKEWRNREGIDQHAHLRRLTAEIKLLRIRPIFGIAISRHSKIIQFNSGGFDTWSGNILSFLLPLFQEGQVSVTGESMCTKYWLTA